MITHVVFVLKLSLCSFIRLNVTLRKSSSFTLVLISMWNPIFLKMLMVVFLVFFVFCLLRFLNSMRLSYQRRSLSFLSIIFLILCSKCVPIRSQYVALSNLHTVVSKDPTYFITSSSLLTVTSRSV